MNRITSTFTSLRMLLIAGLLLFIPSGISAQKIKGNKNVIIEERETADFHSVIVKGDFEVELFEDEYPSVSVETDENLQQYIKTTLHDDALEIYLSQKISRAKIMKIRIGITTGFRYLETRGKSKVYAGYELHTDSITIRTKGNSTVNLFALNAPGLTLAGRDRSTIRMGAEISGNTTLDLSGHNATFLQLSTASLKCLQTENSSLRISGTSDEILLKIQDGSNFNGKEFLTGFADIFAAGSADVHINISEMANLDMSGKADLYLYDNPKEINLNTFTGKCTLYKK